MNMDDEIKAIREDIKSERQYFASILSDDDFKRFKDYTFKLGVLLIYDACMSVGSEH